VNSSSVSKSASNASVVSLLHSRVSVESKNTPAFRCGSQRAGYKVLPAALIH
jgi:hypothetical protein